MTARSNAAQHASFDAILADLTARAPWLATWTPPHTTEQEPTHD